MARKRRVLSEISTDDWAGIRSVARNALGVTGILECDLPDIEQELAVQLVRDVRNFRPRKSTWATFRGTVLRHKLTVILRERSRPGARYMRSPQISLDEPFPGNDGNNPEDETTWLELINEDGIFTDGTEKDEIPHMGLQIDMANFLHGLPLRLRKVCISLLNRNVTETARYLKLSPRSVHRRIEEIRKGMIEAGFGIYISPQNVALYPPTRKIR